MQEIRTAIGDHEAVLRQIDASDDARELIVHALISGLSTLGFGVQPELIQAICEATISTEPERLGAVGMILVHVVNRLVEIVEDENSSESEPTS